MGNKINPIIFRIKNNKDWNSRWFTKKFNKSFIKREILIRNIINNLIPNKLIFKIYIELFNNQTIITIFTINTKLIKYKYKNQLELIKKYLLINNIKNIFLNIKDITINQYLITKFINNIRNNITKKNNYKKEIINIIKIFNNKNLGIKIKLSGRLKGLDIAKKESYYEGNIKNNSINNKIIFLKENFKTKYGIIGIKIWISNDK